MAASVDACASALAACAAQLDVVLARLRRRGAGGHRRAARGLRGAPWRELLAALAREPALGPDRSRLAALARTTDRTAEAAESVAWAWARHPVPELADVLRALGDATRAAARASAAIEDEGGRLVWDTRCREREAEARFLARAGRGALLGRQDDARLAAAAQDLLAYASLWLDALAALRAAVLRFSLD